jgi:outer membrane protein, heavy metal efflux system
MSPAPPHSLGEESSKASTLARLTNIGLGPFLPLLDFGLFCQCPEGHNMNVTNWVRMAVVGWVVCSAHLPVDGAVVETTNSAPSQSIESIVREVLKNHPELEYYRAEIQAARAGRKTAGQWKNPELTAEVGSKRAWDRAGGDVLGDGTAWAVSIAQVVEFPGRTGLRKAIANQQVELAELGLSHFEYMLAARVRSLALEAFSVQQQLEAAKQVARRYKAVTDALVQRDPTGPTPLLEQRIIEAAAISLGRKHAELEREWHRTLLHLNQLRGEPPTAQLRLEDRAVAPASAPSLETLLEIAYSNSFDLKLRKAELEQQGFRVELARKDRFPEVTVAPFYSSEKAADEERIAGISVSLPLPLWSRGNANVQAEQARLAQAEASFRAAWRELERKIAEHLAALKSKQAEMASWRPGAMEAFREAAELADRHYRLGAVPLTTYLSMQTSYIEALDVLFTTQAEVIGHWQELEVLTGRPLEQAPTTITPPSP